jgi:putative membrane protein
MNTPSQAPRSFGVSDYLAVERTFLAWIRTGLAFMGFGFVVARFGRSSKKPAAVSRFGLARR